MKLDVLAVGEVVLDVTADALPGPGERLHRPVWARAGGSSVTAALAAARLGALAGVVGRVGDDWTGRALSAELERRGVRALLTVDGGAPTGTIVSLAGGERAVIADPGAAALLAAADLEGAPEASAVLVSGWSLLSAGPSAAGAAAALERGRSPWTAVDVASAARVRSLGAEHALERLRGAGVLLADAGAAEALTGEQDPAAAARALTEGRRLACVTLGAEGVVAALDGQLLRASPPRRRPGDLVGAGDAFAGALLALLARGEAPAAALERACAAAASSDD